MELYDTDLHTLQQVLPYVETITHEVPDLFTIEIRMRTDDTDQWFVLGWGEAGDPAVLRIEQG